MGETVQLDRQRNIRLSGTEDDALETLARDEGMTVSQLIRRTLRRALFLPGDGTFAPTAGERTTTGGVTGNDDGEPSIKERPASQSVTDGGAE